MVSHDTPALIILIISMLVVGIVNARSWDLAVTIGREVDFFSNNGTMTGRLKNREAVALYSITYDQDSHILFLSDNNNKHVSIFTKNLHSKELKMDPLLNDANGTHVMGMIYDDVSKSLFWTDSKKQAILKMAINEKPHLAEPIILLNLIDESPHGITLDICNRRLYWVNSNISNPSIQSVNLDGTNRTTVVNENLYEPVAVAVDHATGKLYWIDDEEGIHYKIEHSNLDGTNRQLLVHGKHQQPVSIAVDRDFVYWTDWVYGAIWRIKKQVKPGDVAEQWKYFRESNRDADPTSLVARDNLGSIDCVAMSEVQKFINLDDEISNVNNERDNILITSTEEGAGSIASQSLHSCLNGGHIDVLTDTCRCQLGYNGIICEQSLCHNYCLNNGECIVSTNDSVNCKCSSEFTGSRCEERACSDYCLNGGQCKIINNAPFCTCKYSRGSRCEDVSDFTEICTIYCVSKNHALMSSDDNFCACSEKNFTAQQYKIYNNDTWTKTLTVIFPVLIGILIVVIVILSYFVNKFRRRPRIKKRFLVSKTGITPLTSRPQLPSDQCEIMIENCCNMNICETPCFEPKLRNSESSAGKKGEKNSLLDNMEGNNVC